MVFVFSCCVWPPKRTNKCSIRNERRRRDEACVDSSSCSTSIRAAVAVFFPRRIARGGGGEKPRSHQVRHAFCGGVKRIQSPTLVLHFLRVAGLHAMGLQHKLPACALEFKHGSRVRELQRTWEDAFCVHLCGRRCVVLLKVTVAVASTWRPLISEGVRDV